MKLKSKKNCNIIVGVDPGLSGAMIVLLQDIDTGKLHYISSILTPTIKLGTKRNVDLQGTKNWLKAAYSNPYTGCAIVGRHLVIENVHAMPGQGVSSMFNFGRSFGSLEGLAVGIGFRVHYVTPQSWWKLITGFPNKGKASKKELAVAYVQMHGPEDLDLSVKKHAPFADAYMIALAGSKSIGVN